MTLRKRSCSIPNAGIAIVLRQVIDSNGDEFRRTSHFVQSARSRARLTLLHLTPPMLTESLAGKVSSSASSRRSLCHCLCSASDAARASSLDFASSSRRTVTVFVGITESFGKPYNG